MDRALRSIHLHPSVHSRNVNIIISSWQDGVWLDISNYYWYVLVRYTCMKLWIISIINYLFVIGLAAAGASVPFYSVTMRNAMQARRDDIDRMGQTSVQEHTRRRWQTELNEPLLPHCCNEQEYQVIPLNMRWSPSQITCNWLRSEKKRPVTCSFGGF